jgi:hypothetical protein
VRKYVRLLGSGLADKTLTRITDHPVKRIEELLSWNLDPGALSKSAV